MRETIRPPEERMRDGPHVPAAARATYPRRTGNLVRVHFEGAPAFRRICQCIESARTRVWLTVACIEHDTQMPDGRGSFFDVLDTAALRGIDVRVLFWREPDLNRVRPGACQFAGTPDERAWLAQRGSGLRARWDRLDDGFCQHQKSWIIDAGEAGEVAFLGGANPTPQCLSAPGYPPREGGSARDFLLELHGPSATDVHHNFVQRWNEASEREREDGCWPDHASADDLEFPAFLSPAAGHAAVQITRTVQKGRYSDETPTPGAKPFPIAEGEHSIFEQYVSAISAAERSIYIESLAIGSPIIIEELRRALARGVRIAYVVPGNAHPAFVAARRSERAARFFAKLGELGGFRNFTLAAIAASRGEGHYEDIEVHANLACIDDAWATLGSANIVERSFQYDTELNASLWHGEYVRGLRSAILGQLLGRPTDALGDGEALDLLRETALRNCDHRTCWRPMEGLAYAIAPEHYGA
jgi:cardiolipin synthase A/B